MSRIAREDALKRAKDLVALALDESNEEERRNAALKACKYIDKYDLLDQPKGPLDGILDKDITETISEAGEAVAAAKVGFDNLKKIFERHGGGRGRRRYSR